MTFANLTIQQVRQYLDIFLSYTLKRGRVKCSQSVREQHSLLDINRQGSCNCVVQLKFDEPHKDVIACLLYLEHDGSIHIDKLTNVTTDL